MKSFWSSGPFPNFTIVKISTPLLPRLVCSWGGGGRALFSLARQYFIAFLNFLVSVQASGRIRVFNSDLAKKFGSKRILIRNPGCRVAGAVFWSGSYARHWIHLLPEKISQNRNRKDDPAKIQTECRWNSWRAKAVRTKRFWQVTQWTQNRTEKMPARPVG